MPKKPGNGGHGPEEYNPDNGRYVADGETNEEYHPNGSGDLTRGQIDNPVSIDPIRLAAQTVDAEEALDEYNDWALESIMNETGMGWADAAYFQDALLEYLGGDYESFTQGRNPKQTQIIDEGLALMAKYDGEVYRGMSFSKNMPQEMENYKAIMQKLTPGTIFAPNNLSSWTSGRGIGQGYADWDARGKASVFLMIKRGKNKSGVGVKHISKFGDIESEVLFPSTAKFKVISKVAMPKLMSPGESIDIITVEEI